MHPLTKLLLDMENNYSNKEIDKIITTYLTERAGWLKEQERTKTDEGVLSYEQIDQAFELKEERKEKHG